jgi:hypothetical protein
MSRPSIDDELRAKVLADREFPGDWRVEKMDDDGGTEVAVFGGPNARERALRYAEREYGEFDEITPEPYPSIHPPTQ